MTICSRSGCGKQLRNDNTSGKCSSNCLSPDAPASLRAKSVPGRAVEVADDKPKKRDESAEATMEKFRAVATALGFDPDELLLEAAQGWLDEAGRTVRAASGA